MEPLFAPEEFAPTTVGKLVVGDCVDVLREFGEDVFHLSVTDIPYGISADDWDVLHANTNSALGGESPAQRDAGKVFRRRGKPINGWSEADRLIPLQYYEWCTTWAGDLLRVLKPGASLFVFAGRRYGHRAIAALEDAGFNFRDLLAWRRPAAVHRAQRINVVYERRGDLASAEAWGGWRLGNLRPVFEPIIWCQKPYRIGHTVSTNVLEHEVGAYNQDALVRQFGQPNNLMDVGFRPGERGLHPAQKPVDLLAALIEATTRLGHVVLDPFAGSGSTGAAAAALGREFVLVERDPGIAEIARKRLALPSNG